MIRNYLKVAWRNLLKNKAHTFINIAGLSVGLACSLLILLWVQDELDVDAFHKNSDRLFSVIERIYTANKPDASYGTPGMLPLELKKDFPEIEYTSGFGYREKHLFRVNNKMLKFEGASVGADFFKMFSYTLVQGSAASALNTVSSLSISRSMAESFFGSPQNAIGKTILYDGKESLVVTAVFEDLSPAASKHFDFLTTWDFFFKEYPWARDMNNWGPRTYIRLRPDANTALVKQKLFHYLRKFFRDKTAEGYSAELELQRFDEMYLHSNFTDGRISGGKIAYVKLFSIVAVFILLIACINFMNLTSARSVKRAKEIGVRKVVGALRSSLIWQFMMESLLITVSAVLIALLLVILLLPAFNTITQKQIGLPFGQPFFWAELLAVVLITGLISGSYPALFLSSFNTVRVLKGTLKLGSGSAYLRKGLVTFQFVLSMLLITGTIAVSRQVNYIQSLNLGYDRDNLLYIPLEGNLVNGYPTFKNEALKMPGIRSLSRATFIVADNEASDDAIDWDGKDPRLRMEFSYLFVGYDFTKTLNLKLKEGRDFSPDFPNDTSNFLVNETALKTIGYTNPVGRRLTFIGKRGKIIGVLKDFHYKSLHEAIAPQIILLGEHDNSGFAVVRIQAGKTGEVLAGLGRLYKQMNPNFLFSYSFADEEYNKLYNDEKVIGRLSKVFASLAIFISCLGLLGLIMFTAEQKNKEISIRKVLGAGTGSLYALLSAEFLWLILSALLIAAPLAWLAIYKWLQNFPYHAAIEWWMFVIAGIIIILIALITVSYQAIKAALVNPVKSLRSE